MPLKSNKGHTSFYIITGGPGVGKTTLLDELHSRGMTVVPEIARELIKEQQDIDGPALPWRDKKLYMELMFHRSVESFETTIQSSKGSTPIFFDRGFLDAICYAALEGIPIDQEMKTLCEILRYNPNVFILPPWREIYRTDEQRKQDWNEAVFTYNKMIETYRSYQYDLVEVPKMLVQERGDFIMGFIKNNPM
ncbi:Predicted ATPase [Flagellimonas taeanensis]|uniref:Predicted ATPase n=1 Tax=Flagellimonas taeanensis TaxID=1005926 RepID=A0A1M6Z853_9FLAO|nr:AAA family ATPase [Allomuricauda taeanensis]SFC11021.1 Predicted ATPase [Allomuricauda taeanensis]SHL26612.1 Predicted ATPase [Allomuricauda taeanensis]